MNEYRVTVSFGDGNPKKATIKAKNGLAAQEAAFKQFAGARYVHVLGLVSNEPKKPEPLPPSNLVYGYQMSPGWKKRSQIIPLRLANNQVNPLLIEAMQLKEAGLSQTRIADSLGISRGVLRRLLKASL
jgi:hypothetical protein